MPRPPHRREAHVRAQGNRKDMPSPEVAIWAAIRRGQMGVRFRRQVPIGPWIADFACLAPKVVIEIDGQSHDGPEIRRTADIEAAGFEIIRIDNEDVIRHYSDIIYGLREQLRTLASEGRKG